MTTVNVKKHLKNRKGLTLVEIILALAFLAIITVSFLPLFVMSARVTAMSRDNLAATYSGKDAMEQMYEMSHTAQVADIETNMTNLGYAKTGVDAYAFTNPNGKNLDVHFTDTGSMIRVVVKVYRDATKTNLDSQYEAYYDWNR